MWFDIIPLLKSEASTDTQCSYAVSERECDLCLGKKVSLVLEGSATWTGGM